MKLNRSAATLALGAALVLGWEAPVAALNPDSSPATKAAQAPYSDAEVRSFSVALLNVQRIKLQMLDRMSAAGSAEEANVVQYAAQDEMVKAVQEEGLSVDRYNAIVMELQANPELARQVKRHLDTVE